MHDYLVVIYHTPLYTAHLLAHLTQVILGLPWPPAREFFGSMVIFVGLYPIRALMKAILPEERVARRLYKRRKKGVPSPHEHQSAAAAVSTLFH